MQTKAIHQKYEVKFDRLLLVGLVGQVINLLFVETHVNSFAIAQGKTHSYALFIPTSASNRRLERWR